MTNLSKNISELMLGSFLSFLNKHDLLISESKTLLSVSGGIDSMVLVDLFKNAGFNFGIAHCNFQLRGAESDQDEVFVEELANSLGVEFFKKRFEVAQSSKEIGVSIQMMARNVRYEWFKQLAVDYQFDQIATAHHLNDNIETIFYNLARGTGIAGMRGIKPKVDNVIRPLLFASRSEIQQYALENIIQWREDSSNALNKYSRNLIRNKIIPRFKDINPNLENTFIQTIARISAVEEFFKVNVNEIKKSSIEIRGNDRWIPVSRINALPGREAILYEIVEEYGFNFTQALEIINSFDKQSGNLFYSDTHLLNVDRNSIIISPLMEGIKEYVIKDFNSEIGADDFSLRFEIKDSKDVRISTSRNVAFVDMGKVNLPFKLRLWQKGDRFIPLGMKNKKKLSDFMIDEKIPVNLKRKTYVLTSNGEIFWVVGRRLDDKVKITPTTSKTLIITKLAKDD